MAKQQFTYYVKAEVTVTADSLSAAEDKVMDVKASLEWTLNNVEVELKDSEQVATEP